MSGHALGGGYMRGLYRRLWRAAAKMPTDARRDLIRAKTRHGFREEAGETDLQKIQELARLGEAQLDNVEAQAAHLTECFNMPGMHSRV